MLATRIVVTLLCRGRTLVKGVAFDSWRSVGLAAQAARIHSMRGVDELVILDIGATPEGRGPDLGLIRELSETCFIPLTVGGGIRTVDDVEQLMRNGADKVCIGKAALLGTLIYDCAKRFGSQAIVVAIDVTPEGRVRTMGAGPGPRLYAQDMERVGAGEILLTAMDREGVLNGYDLDLIKAVSDAVNIPVIANGGCGIYEHMLDAIKAGANGVAAGAMFQFTDATPKGAAEYLATKGIEVRL